MARSEVVSCSGKVCGMLERALNGEAVRAFMMAGYCSIQGEVELGRIFVFRRELGLPVLLPRFVSSRVGYELVEVMDLTHQLTTGTFGIPEPAGFLSAVPRESVESPGTVWLIPGVAFDQNGHRLGRGRGYYDRLLKDTSGTRIGVCYDWQILPEIPTEEYDVSMNLLVSDRRIIECS